MRQPPTIDDPLMIAPRMGLAGAILLAAGLLAADRAIAHMAWLKTICGGGSDPHCGWCLAAAALIMAGLAALALAAQPRLQVKAAPSLRRVI